MQLERLMLNGFDKRKFQWTHLLFSAKILSIEKVFNGKTPRCIIRVYPKKNFDERL